uniref:Uncharacterized protein n=1 Tax=Candidatus Kentrum eta TaxID=2126337 RepID=A0A450U894_9GAMM|nr:MAG: hypothetical protein BECKH772A_GA0070896_1000722 [Candidatus Kentron sp. H]VFJ90172.1 MAG: hypothetical protein BECKH772B_GA0070898_1000822 [Candidatus Kentron sp. H]VFJ96544.1 MAG: hypothetical protein BECKH772C_GA0070978_1000722 [Candidatus Kentron sp. H]
MGDDKAILETTTTIRQEIHKPHPIHFRSCLEIRNLPRRGPNCVLPRCDGGENCVV